MGNHTEQGIEPLENRKGNSCISVPGVHAQHMRGSGFNPKQPLVGEGERVRSSRASSVTGLVCALPRLHPSQK